MHLFFFMITDAEDHLQEIHGSIWTYAMAKVSICTPRFFPYTYETLVNELLRRHLKMTRYDINVENWESFYKFLINKIN